ncbi:MAG: hypothetical protein AB1486_13870 [Planctomycetota bacterium]
MIVSAAGFTASLVLTFIFSVALRAQDTPDQAPRPPRAASSGEIQWLARAADLDRDGCVTTEEWDSFVAELATDDQGRIDRDILLVRALEPFLDVDEDLLFTLVDVDRAFARLDRNGDGAITSDEGRRSDARAQRGDRRAESGTGAQRRRPNMLLTGILLAAADGDGDGNVTREEWTLLRGTQAADNTPLPEATVVGWIRSARQAREADRTAFTPGVLLVTLESLLDANHDGSVDGTDLAKHFASLDRDADGTLELDELNPPPPAAAPQGAAAGGGEEWRVPEEARTRPALMPWQRNLDDALALVEKTGKPLLICVNMDDEPASESLAWVRYRDPEFAALASGFIPLIVSPDRRQPRDHDDRGRRLPDERFGRVVNSEPIALEPIVFERYFDERRVAPRHLAIDAKGVKLFDIYLANDLSVIDEALRQHGRFDVRQEDPRGLDEIALLDSPDAAHRDRLEGLFVAGDENTRVRLACLCLSAVRRTQHPEILRLALRDGAESVRLQAVWTLAQHPEKAPLDLFVRAFVVAHGHEAESAALTAALGRLAQPADDARERGRARRLFLVFSTLERPSQWLDREKWQLVLKLAPRIEEVPPTSGASNEGEPDAEEVALNEIAGALRNALAGAPDDIELHLQLAEAGMRFARFYRERDEGRISALDAAIASATKARDLDPDDGRASGYLVWARSLLDEMVPDDASAIADEAAIALLGLWRDAGSLLTVEVLDTFARSRTQALYERLGAGTDWPAEWIPDIRAAYEVLLAHPGAREDHKVAAIEFLEAIQAFGFEAELLRRELERDRVSGRLHALLRIQKLRDEGADGLEAAYTEWLLQDAAPEAAPQEGASLLWYAGLARLMVAERYVECRRFDDALQAYHRCIDSFQQSIDLNETFGEYANHYASMAWHGIAELDIKRGEWEAAVEALTRAIALSPMSWKTADGLGQTTAAIASKLQRRLESAGRGDLAQRITASLSEAGLEIERPRTEERESGDRASGT